MAQWLSFPMISETTGLVLEGEDLDLRWASGGWLFHSLGDCFGSSPCSALNWLIFLLIIVGRNFGPRMMHASALCPIFLQNSQILFCNCIVAGIWRAEMMRTMTLIGQCGWISNHLLITLNTMNFSARIDSIFYVVVKEGDEICHLWRNKRSEFLTLYQCLHVLEEKSGRGDNFSGENNFLLESDNPAMKSSSCSPLLKASVARSYWTLPFIPPRWGAREWRTLEKIVHPNISWVWVLKNL